jgi:hypothetical protein
MTPKNTSQHPSTVASNDMKRWAVMMVGGARTYAFTRESFLRNVVNQADPPMDIFVSTHSNPSCSVDGLSAVLLEMDSTAWLYREMPSGLDEYQQTVDRFQGDQMGLLQLIDNYVEGEDISYDYILFTRPDLHYTVPINIKKLETIFDEGGDNGTIFTPECCGQGDEGWCDRLAAAKYKDFSHMIRSTERWLATGDRSIWEVAFMFRGLLANLTRFDMHEMPNMTDDYGFVTLRLGAALEHCKERYEEWYIWVDVGCNNDAGVNYFNDTSATCKFLNESLKRNERCRNNGWT